MRGFIERSTSYWRMRWSAFDYNYGWSDYLYLFDGWVAKCAMGVPVIGYLILFNDSISQHLSFNKLASKNVLGFGLSSGARLKLIYFGLIFLGSANILYRIHRPFVFKIGTNQFEYVENALKHFTVSAYMRFSGGAALNVRLSSNAHQFAPSETRSISISIFGQPLQRFPSFLKKLKTHRVQMTPISSLLTGAFSIR